MEIGEALHESRLRPGRYCNSLKAVDLGWNCQINDEGRQWTWPLSISNRGGSRYLCTLASLCSGLAPERCGSHEVFSTCLLSAICCYIMYLGCLVHAKVMIALRFQNDSGMGRESAKGYEGTSELVIDSNVQRR